MGKGKSLKGRRSLMEPEVPNYLIEFDELVYENLPPSDDGSEFSFQGDYGVSVTLRGIYTREVKGPEVRLVGKYTQTYGYDQLEAGDTAHLVVVCYQTGGTFGSHGAWTVPAIKRERCEAERIASLCEKPDPQGLKRDWDGYFEELTSVEVVSLKVK